MSKSVHSSPLFLWFSSTHGIFAKFILVVASADQLVLSYFIEDQSPTRSH